MSSRITLLFAMLSVFQIIIAVNEATSRLLLQSTDKDITGGYTTYGGSFISFIMRAGDKLIVDMSNSGRPNAYGTYNTNTKSGQITFPDDKTYAITFDSNKDRIIWGGNDNVFWSKQLPDVADITGNYIIAYSGTVVSMFVVRIGDKLEVDMSELARPTGTGTYDMDSKTGKITFPDDNTYLFTFDTASGNIIFSNSAVWHKKLVDVSAISGKYKCPSTVCFIIQKGNTISVDMSVFGRPNGYGTYDVNTRAGQVTFPGDQTYAFTFDINNGHIVWNNDPNYAWYKQISDVSNSVLYIAQKYAPILRFDSQAHLNSNGFPTGWDYPNGNINKQNVNAAISTIPTYYYVFRNAVSKKAEAIGYYWYYAYQQQCISSDTINGIIGPLNDYPINLIYNVDDLFAESFDSFGSHNNDREHVIVHLNENQLMTHVTYYQHGGQYRLAANQIELSNGKPNVYIGRIAHGSYHNKYKSNNDLDQCGYFYDNRDGAYTLDSADNLHILANKYVEKNRPEITTCPDAENPGCNWNVCATNPTDEKCIPLKCESKGLDGNCYPRGVFDVYEAALEVASAAVNAMNFPYFKFTYIGYECCYEVANVCVSAKVVWAQCLGSV